MERQEILKILTEGAKYDVSCSSSGSTRKLGKGVMGNAHFSGICHSWSEDGRCISLLKILMTNACVYDCLYCVNRRSRDVPRVSLSPEELCEITWEFYRRNYIEGLFLSSGVYPSVDETMEKLIRTVTLLRNRGFQGYIHCKGIPGADESLFRQLGFLVDRISVNRELPTARGLAVLAPQKKGEEILRSMTSLREYREEYKNIRGKSFLPGGQTTQMIVGASGETDLEILTQAEGLYRKEELKRVYYSAFVPVLPSPLAPGLRKAPLLREHRMYQGDFLLRYYRFHAQELLGEDRPFFDYSLDPKTNWALDHFHLFPMEINRISYEELLRIPGFGPKTAGKIVGARRLGALKVEDLKVLGATLKKAKHFITVGGKFLGGYPDRPDLLRKILSEEPEVQQLSFLEGVC